MQHSARLNDFQAIDTPLAMGIVLGQTHDSDTIPDRQFANGLNSRDNKPMSDISDFATHNAAPIASTPLLDNVETKLIVGVGHNDPVTGNTSHTKPENRAFYPALDGLRAVAFLMVFFQHYRQMPWGWTGVDLFFVLSGFLITGILFDTRDDPHRVRNFYIRRTLRIFPLYYGIMLAIILTIPIMHWNVTWKWLVWPAYLGNYARFIHNYLPDTPLQRMADFQPSHGIHSMLFLGHFWSLCVEEQFYLVWPWLVFWIRDRRKLLWICAVTVPVCLAMRLAGQHYLPTWMLDNEILYRATPFRLDALLLGGLIALVLRGPHAQSLLRTARIALPILLAAVLLWAMLTPAHHILTKPYPYPDYKFTWGLSAFDILAAVLILVALQPGTLVYRIFRLRPLRWMGRISYGAYVLHDIPHFGYYKIARAVLPSHPILAMQTIALVSTMLLAWLSFRFFESPFLDLKERWTIRTP
jgi:peptidoglycan/LPS O-acetylase OafA/YrhL